MGEAVNNLLTQAIIHYEQRPSGLIDLSIETQSLFYQIDVFSIAIWVTFLVFFLINLYIFVASEYSIY